MTKRRAGIFRTRYLPPVRAFPGTRELLSTLKESAKPAAV
jgi:hypothetical protein